VRISRLPGAAEDEASRRPDFGGRRIKAARLLRVLLRRGQRLAIGIGVDASRLESHRVGVRQADVRHRVVGKRLQHLLEVAAGTREVIGLQRFERGTAIQPRAMRRHQRLETVVRGAGGLPLG